MTPSLRLVVAVALGLLLATAGFGSAAQAHAWNQQCHEEWDGVEDVHADCDDFLYVAMFYGGGGAWLAGLGLLVAAGWEYRRAAAD